jgi:hypothetical protein
MREVETLMHSIRSIISEKETPVAALLESVGPLLTQNKQTAKHWEKIETVLTRAIAQVISDSKPFAYTQIRQILKPIVPFTYHYYLEPNIREIVIMELGKLHYHLTFVAGFEPVILNLLPRKRGLHAYLANSCSDICLLISALNVALIFRQQFFNTLLHFLSQIDMALNTVKNRELPLCIEINSICQSLGKNFDWTNEEHIAKLEKLSLLAKKLKDFICQYGLGHVFQPTAEQKLEAILVYQGEQIVTQAALPEERKNSSASNAFRLAFLLKPWEKDLLLITKEKSAGSRVLANHEVLLRGITIINALEGLTGADAMAPSRLQFLKYFAEKDLGSVISYLQTQLKNTTKHIEWLASLPCRNKGEIIQANNLWRSRKQMCRYLNLAQLPERGQESGIGDQGRLKTA